MTRENINNSGRGNCMYYAYGISLMYYLLNKRDRPTADTVFNKLDLSPSQKRQLHALLDNTSISRFSVQQITEIIEPILGPATRKFGADKTFENFLQSPQASPLFQAANYGMSYLFRREMESHADTLAAVLSNNNFDDHNYIDSEIFRLFKIEGLELKGFIAREYETIMKQFKEGWPNRVDNVFVDIQGIKSREDIAADNFYKQQFLVECIGEKTIEFFTQNKNANLTTYRNRLAKDCEFGSDETLLLLHRHVQGEQRTYRNGLHSFEWETEISFAIHRDGLPEAAPTADIVLVNKGNYHWLSLVRPAIHSTSLTVSQSQTENRMTILLVCDFNYYLQQLDTKGAELVRNYPMASEQAFHIVDKLTEAKNEFIKADSVMTAKEFSDQCQLIISTADKHHLESHRGIKGILNAMLNALIFVANLFIGLGNFLYGKFELIDPIHSPTESIKQVNIIGKSIADTETLEASLAVSLSALKIRRERTDKASEAQIASEGTNTEPQIKSSPTTLSCWVWKPHS